MWCMCLRSILVGGALLLAGCAATVNRGEPGQAPVVVSKAAQGKIVMLVKGSDEISRSRDWNEFRAEWKTAMEAAAAGAGMGFAFVDQEPAAHNDSGTLVVVDINDYRYLSAGARLMLGILVGNAYIDAKAAYFELPERRAFAERKYNTSSSAWQGIFSAMTAKQIAAICAEIVGELGRASPRT